MQPWTVTLEQLRNANACSNGYNKVMAMINERGLGDDEPVSLIDIAEHLGVEEALWALRIIETQHRRDILKFSIWCVRRVQHLMDSEHSKNALIAIFKYADWKISDEQLMVACGAAYIPLKRTSGNLATDSARCCVYNAADVGTYGLAGAATGASWYSIRAESLSLATGDVQRSEIRARLMGEHKDVFIQMCQGTAPWQTTGYPD